MVNKSNVKWVQALLLRFASVLEECSEEITEAAMSSEADAQEMVNVMQEQINMIELELLPAYQSDLDTTSKFYVKESA